MSDLVQITYNVQTTSTITSRLYYATVYREAIHNGKRQIVTGRSTPHYMDRKKAYREGVKLKKRWIKSDLSGGL